MRHTLPPEASAGSIRRKHPQLTDDGQVALLRVRVEDGRLGGHFTLVGAFCIDGDVAEDHTASHVRFVLRPHRNDIK